MRSYNAVIAILWRCAVTLRLKRKALCPTHKSALARATRVRAADSPPEDLGTQLF